MGITAFEGSVGATPLRWPRLFFWVFVSSLFKPYPKFWNLSTFVPAPVQVPFSMPEEKASSAGIDGIVGAGYRVIQPLAKNRLAETCGNDQGQGGDGDYHPDSKPPVKTPLRGQLLITQKQSR